jgi:hypothetical protein
MMDMMKKRRFMDALTDHVFLILSIMLILPKF